VAQVGETGRERRADVAAADDGDVQGHHPSVGHDRV
jgi:hypothetical protein